MLTLLLACDPEAGPPGGDSSTDPDSPADSVEQLPQGGDCRPAAESVYGTEGETLVLTFACSGAEVADITLGALPPGATAEGLTVTWTPGLDQAGRWDVGAEAGVGDIGVGTFWVADAWKDPANEPVDPATYEMEDGLPVVHLTVPGSTNFESTVPSEMVYRGHTFEVDLKYRGAASSGYPKLSYTVHFPKDDEMEDEALGFVKRREVVLISTFDDNSYIRQNLCFDAWNAMDPSREPVQTQHVVVYKNGIYEGLFVLADHIDGEYWEDAGYSEDGNLYKSVDHSANFQNKSWLASGWEKKEGEPITDFSDLEALTYWVGTSSNADFEALGAQYFVPEEFYDWFALVVFSEATDSGGKNAYIYRDPAETAFHYRPWDFNSSWGQTWQTDRQSAQTDNDFTWANTIFARTLANPTLKSRMLERFQDHRHDGPLAEETLLANAEALWTQIDRAAARDWDKWGASYRSYGGWYWRSNWTDYEGEKAYLRQWIRDRAAYAESRWAP